MSEMQQVPKASTETGMIEKRDLPTCDGVEELGPNSNGITPANLHIKQYLMEHVPVFNKLEKIRQKATV